MTTNAPSITWKDAKLQTTSTARLHGNWFIDQVTFAGGSTTTVQTLRIHYTDWNQKGNTAWLIDNKFLGIADPAETVDTASMAIFDPSTCLAASTCFYSPSINYVGADGKYYTATVKPAGAPAQVNTSPVTAPTESAGLADIYVVNSDGTLSCFQHDGYLNGASLWQKDGGLEVGHGWKDFRQVFSAAGAIYAIQPDGTLLWYQHHGYATCAAQPWSGSLPVGHDWQNFKQVFPMTTSSGNGAIIYAIQSDGMLQWYKHLGYSDGSNTWSGPNSIGTGWQNFKQVFSTGDGVIYAIQNDGTLQWYRHLGYGDGSNTWSDPTSVGSGWQTFLGVFLRSPAPGAASN
ncbi:MAG TPA: tachylectin-related carbohydrate-binding protein [Chloroflexota bacterium]